MLLLLEYRLSARDSGDDGLSPRNISLSRLERVEQCDGVRSFRVTSSPLPVFPRKALPPLLSRRSLFAELKYSES